MSGDRGALRPRARLRPWVLAVACAGAVPGAGTGFAFAGDRERALEDRVRYLEGRLEKLESLMGGSSGPSVSRKPRGRGGSERRLAAAAPSAEVVAGAPAVAAPPQKAALASVDGAPADSPQETFIFRDNSVSLKPRSWEVSTDVGYTNASGFLQSDRVIQSATTARIGVLDWLEVSGTVPAYTSTRRTSTGPFRVSSREVSGLGDATAQLNARLFEQSPDLPGAVLSLGAIFPTGPKPYDFRTFQPNPSEAFYNPNPIKLEESLASRGAWGALSNLQFYKTVDPIILFGGVGLQYFFDQGVGGHSVQQGTRITYNAGMSFALSERSTLGLQLNGSYQRSLTVDRLKVPGSDIEPISGRFSLIQRVAKSTYIEPSVTFGLSRNAPDVTIGLGLRHRSE